MVRVSKDITSTMSQVFGLLGDGFSAFFSYLDSFQFFGITLLDFCLNIFLVSAFIPIILTLVKVDFVASYRENRSRIRAKTARGRKWLKRLRKG